MTEPAGAVHRRDQNRHIHENDFDDVRMFANCGLHWAGFQTWFGQPVAEMKQYVFDAWPDLFAKIETNDQRETQKRAARRAP